MINFLTEHGIETIEEDRGRVLLKSGKARQLRDLLVQLSQERGVVFHMNQNIVQIIPIDEEAYRYQIVTEQETFLSKNMIVATGGKSYPQVGATALGYDIAGQFALRYVAPRPALCGMETVEDVLSLAGSPTQGMLTVFADKKIIYQNS